MVDQSVRQRLTYGNDINSECMHVSRQIRALISNAVKCLPVHAEIVEALHVEYIFYRVSR